MTTTYYVSVRNPKEPVEDGYWQEFPTAEEALVAAATTAERLPGIYTVQAVRMVGSLEQPIGPALNGQRAPLPPAIDPVTGWSMNDYDDEYPGGA